MTFKERFQAGGCTIDTINDWISAWHAGNMKQSLPCFLGLTDEEYGLWQSQGEAALSEFLSRDAKPCYTASHIGWAELREQLTEFVQSRLGTNYTLSIWRSINYYWDLKLHTEEKIDEQCSGHICTQLSLCDIDPAHFVDCRLIEQEQLNGLLEKMLHKKVKFNYADEKGVWIFYRSLCLSDE